MSLIRRFPLNLECANMFISVSSFDTFHFEISPIKSEYAKTFEKSVICDTSI